MTLFVAFKFNEPLQKVIPEVVPLSQVLLEGGKRVWPLRPLMERRDSVKSTLKEFSHEVIQDKSVFPVYLSEGLNQMLFRLYTEVKGA